MALNAHLTLVGQIQGPIRGSANQSGREETIIVRAVDHQVNAVLDANGLPAGARKHQPIVLSVTADRAAPLIQQALTTNETMTTFRLDFYQTSTAGPEQRHYRITLTGARVIGMKLEMLNNAYSDLASVPMQYKVAFAYASIEWEHTLASIVSTDSWG